MQAARLKFFVEEIRKDSAFATYVSAWTVNVKMHERWTTEAQEDIQDKDLSQRFDNLLTTGRHWRPAHSRTAYFPIQQLSLVLGADFQSPPRTKTQSKTAAALKRALKHSQDAFNANHDALTGAQNRVAYEKKLMEGIEASLLKIELTSDVLTEVEVTVPYTLALLALDIDHFKQLNDTFGHLYGDVVLQVFVRRIESCLTGLERKFGERLQTSFARLGGEEFGILVRGGLATNDLKQVADEIRDAIANDPLPTDEEWATMKQAISIASLSLPHVTTRRVTVSIGIAVLTPTPIEQESTAISSCTSLGSGLAIIHSLDRTRPSHASRLPRPRLVSLIENRLGPPSVHPTASRLSLKSRNGSCRRFHVSRRRKRGHSELF